MTFLIAVYCFVAVTVALFVGALGLVLVSTQDVRTAIERGIGDR